MCLTLASETIKAMHHQTHQINMLYLSQQWQNIKQLHAITCLFQLGFRINFYFFKNYINNL